VVGKPNAEIDLANRLIGQKAEHCQSEAQSTRDRVVGILTRGELQMIRSTLPGSSTALRSPTSNAAVSRTAIDDADVTLHLIDAIEPSFESLVAREPRAQPELRFHGVHKIDRLSSNECRCVRNDQPGASFISAANGDASTRCSPDSGELPSRSPFLYSADDVSTPAGPLLPPNW